MTDKKTYDIVTLGDEEELANKVADMQDNPSHTWSGLTKDQKDLVNAVENTIALHKQTTNQPEQKNKPEIRGPQDLERQIEELKNRVHTAQNELSLIRAVGMNSPEMKECKKKIKELDDRLAEVLMIDDQHRVMNGKLNMRIVELEQEVLELHADNKKLALQVDDYVNKLRSNGFV